MSYSQHVLAVHYSKTLLNVATHQQCTSQVYNDMELLHQVLQKGSRSVSYIKNPAYPRASRLQNLTHVLENKISPLSLHFIKFLFDKKRETLIDHIIAVFLEQYQRTERCFTAHVITAIPLNTGLREALVTKAKDLVHARKINLIEEVDEKILGGYILRIDDQQIDASLAGKLAKLHRQLEHFNSC